MMHRALISVLVLACATFAQAAAPSECWTQRKHGETEPAHACFESLTRSRDAASRAEGFWGLEQWDQANEQFRLAAAQPDSRADVKVRWGLLLHERFNDAEAAGLFREALQKEPSNAEAYLALATVSEGSFSGQAAAFAAKAVEINPKLAAAHELMADMALTNDDREAAVIEADKALALTL